MVTTMLCVAQQFEIQQIRDTDPEYGNPFTRYLVVAGDKKLGLVPPEKWRMTGDNGKRRITFTHEQMKATITLTLLHPNDIPEPKLKPGQEPPAPGSPPTPEQWREWVKENFVGAVVDKEWESIANGARALTFDMSYAAGGVRQSVRTAYVSRRGLHIELVLRTGGRISDYLGTYMGVLGSFEYN